MLDGYRSVREVDAPPPSTRLSSSAALPVISGQPEHGAFTTRRSYAGELDWVLLKALEKDRAGSCETANGLARDIQHYLADKVVEARPPSASYRLWKFARASHCLDDRRGDDRAAAGRRGHRAPGRRCGQRRSIPQVVAEQRERVRVQVNALRKTDISQVPYLIEVSSRSAFRSCRKSANCSSGPTWTRNGCG